MISDIKTNIIIEFGKLKKIKTFLRKLKDVIKTITSLKEQIISKLLRKLWKMTC